MWKKLLALLILGVFVATMSLGCKKTEEPAEEEGETPTEEPMGG